MAQIGVQQPTSLMDMYSSGSPMMWDIANQQVNQQAQSNYLNQQQAAQDMNIQAQDQPAKLASLYLANQEQGARIPGVAAQSNILGNQADVSNSTLDMQKKAKYSELAKTMSDNDLSEAENAIKTALVHPSAAVRQHAESMWNDLSSVKELKLKNQLEGDRALSVVGEQGNQARQTDKQAAEEGKYLKRWSMNADQQITFEGDPVKRDALIRGALQAAQNDNNPSLVEKYTSYLQANKPAYDNAMKAKTSANAAKVDPNAMLGTDSIQSPTAQIPRTSPQPDQEAPPAGQVTPDAVKQAFGAYEPTKYKYRMGPNGKLQRKAI